MFGCVERGLGMRSNMAHVSSLERAWGLEFQAYGGLAPAVRLTKASIKRRPYSGVLRQNMHVLYAHELWHTRILPQSHKPGYQHGTPSIHGVSR